MDQFSAHLDRGWDLVQRGDTRGALASARRALELDPNSPEAHNLLGYVAALEGDGDEAVEAYRQAIALDDTYLEAMLNAAEVYIHPLGDFDQAISMCDQALDVAEADDEVVDALLLKFDALLGKGDLDAAKKLVPLFPAGPFDNPSHTFLVGRALYEVGDVERALPYVEDAIRRDPRNSEAYYYLGLVRDEQGDTRAATAAFLTSRELDLSTAMPAWVPGRDELLETTKAAVAALAPSLRALVDGAEVFLTEMPGVEVIADGVDPRATVLVDAPVRAPADGAHEHDGDGDGEARPPVRIFVYILNVARLAGTADALQEEIQLAIEREITSTMLEESEPGGALN